MRVSYLFILTLLLNSCGIIHSQEKINALPDSLDESSGLQRLSSGQFASINDSGNDALIYILDSLGQQVSTVGINECVNNDWEALAMDAQNRLYIGDFGNNKNKRKNLKIQVLSGDIAQKTEAKPEYMINFYYADQKEFQSGKEKMRFDCEAMYANADYVYVFTKSRVEPFDGKSYIYRIPNKKGDYEAKKVGVLELCTKGKIRCWVTAAAVHHEKGELAILTTKKVYYYRLPQETKWTGEQLEFLGFQKLNGIKQREAISYDASGQNLYMTDEKHRLLGGGNFYKLNIERSK